MAMKIKPLNVGLESFTRVALDADVHLPKEAPVGPVFLPQFRPLDEVLRRPSLEERLPQLLQPGTLDTTLLEPSVLTETRRFAQANLREASRRMTGHKRQVLEQAARCLEDDMVLDDEVRAALATLLRA